MWRKVVRSGQTSLILVLSSWNQGKEEIAILSGKIGEYIWFNYRTTWTFGPQPLKPINGRWVSECDRIERMYLQHRHAQLMKMPVDCCLVCTFSESDILIESLNWTRTLTSQITGKYKLVYFHVDALTFNYDTTYCVKQVHGRSCE